jgi:RecB family exonuclease
MSCGRRRAALDLHRDQYRRCDSAPWLNGNAHDRERCPLQYAFNYVYGMPPREEPVAAFTFGSTAHEAFEAFTRERRERAARGDLPPTRDDLEREFRARWTPTGFGDKTTEEGYQRRVATLLDNFWEGEVSSLSEALREEEPFELTLAPNDGSALVVITGSIDRIDRLPSGGIEVIDYKTGRVSSYRDGPSANRGFRSLRAPASAGGLHRRTDRNGSTWHWLLCGPGPTLRRKAA